MSLKLVEFECEPKTYLTFSKTSFYTYILVYILNFLYTTQGKLFWNGVFSKKKWNKGKKYYYLMRYATFYSQEYIAKTHFIPFVYAVSGMYFYFIVDGL